MRKQGLIIPGRSESYEFYFFGLKPNLNKIELVRPFGLRQFKPIKFIQQREYGMAIYDGLKLDLFSEEEPDKQIMDQAKDLQHYMGHRVLLPTVTVVPDKHFANFRM